MLEQVMSRLDTSKVGAQDDNLMSSGHCNDTKKFDDEKV